MHGVDPQRGGVRLAAQALCTCDLQFAGHMVFAESMRFSADLEPQAHSSV